jgi:hypothetical protein
MQGYTLGQTGDGGLDHRQTMPTATISRSPAAATASPARFIDLIPGYGKSAAWRGLYASRVPASPQMYCFSRSSRTGRDCIPKPAGPVCRRPHAPVSRAGTQKPPACLGISAWLVGSGATNSPRRLWHFDGMGFDAWGSRGAASPGLPAANAKASRLSHTERQRPARLAVKARSTL